MKWGFILLCFVSLQVSAQINVAPVQLLHYALNTFTPGKVKLKSGTVTQQVLNYNLLTKEMIFDNNGNYLAIAHPEEVDSVMIGERIFVPVDKGFYEVLYQGAYPLLVEYTCKIKEPGSPTGYGSSSNTTASTPLKSLLNNNGAYKLKLPDEFELLTGQNYYLFKNGRYNKINSEQQFLKLFSDRKAEVKKVIENNHIKFSKKEDLVALVKQIQ